MSQEAWQARVQWAVFVVDDQQPLAFRARRVSARNLTQEEAVRVMNELRERDPATPYQRWIDRDLPADAGWTPETWAARYPGVQPQRLFAAGVPAPPEAVLVGAGAKGGEKDFGSPSASEPERADGGKPPPR